MSDEAGSDAANGGTMPGDPPSPKPAEAAPAADNARAEPVLRDFRQRLSGDRYTVLGAPRDASTRRGV